MHNFKELVVWQKGRKLVQITYEVSSKFPHEERFGLTNQMRRAAVSIPFNIAEGAGRGSNADFNRFLDMAQGSAFELETQIYLCSDLSFLSNNLKNEILGQVQEIQNMINSLKKNLRHRSAS